MKFTTQLIHAGYSPEPTSKSAAVPIYQTVSYTFDNTQHGADLFNLDVAGNIYTRIMNPTTAILEDRLTAIEGGVGSLVVASGMAAINYAVLNICEAGDNIIASSAVYGGTYNLFAHALPRLGIEVRFFDIDKPEDIEKLADSKSKMVFCETISNPAVKVADIPKLAQIAHSLKLPLIADNTVSSPALIKPLEKGADIVIEALTKFINGHGNALGGAIIDGGSFDWTCDERYKVLFSPDPSYHGVNYTERFKNAAFIARARVAPLRNTGSAISPFNVLLILNGLQTLNLRMERHSSNSLAIAQFLKTHPNVSWVNYPALPDSPYKALIERDYCNQGSGVLSFGIKGGREAGAKFIDALKLFYRLVNIGDTKSLATHSASTTHRQLDAQQLKKAGVSEDMIRLSVGLEDVEDLIFDLNQALVC